MWISDGREGGGKGREGKEREERREGKGRRDGALGDRTRHFDIDKVTM